MNHIISSSVPATLHALVQLQNQPLHTPLSRQAKDESSFSIPISIHNFMPCFLFHRAWIAPDLAFYLYFLQQTRKEEGVVYSLLLSNDLSHKIHPASFFEACSETILLHC